MTITFIQWMNELSTIIYINLAIIIFTREKSPPRFD